MTHRWQNVMSHTSTPGRYTENTAAASPMPQKPGVVGELTLKGDIPAPESNLRPWPSDTNGNVKPLERIIPLGHTYP